MKKTYQLSLICEYDNKKEMHILYIGSINQCRAIKLLAKNKEKQFRKAESIPMDAKITYTIERINNNG